MPPSLPVIPSSTPPIAIIDDAERSGTGAKASPLGPLSPVMKLAFDRRSRGGVVFANRVAGLVRHEEVVARHREFIG